MTVVACAAASSGPQFQHCRRGSHREIGRHKVGLLATHGAPHPLAARAALVDSFIRLELTAPPGPCMALARSAQTRSLHVRPRLCLFHRRASTSPASLPGSRPTMALLEPAVASTAPCKPSPPLPMLLVAAFSPSMCIAHELSVGELCLPSGSSVLSNFACPPYNPPRPPTPCPDLHSYLQR
jgi:hypothetical protein